MKNHTVASIPTDNAIQPFFVLIISFYCANDLHMKQLRDTVSSINKVRENNQLLFSDIIYCGFSNDSFFENISKLDLDKVVFVPTNKGKMYNLNFARSRFNADTIFLYMDGDIQLNETLTGSAAARLYDAISQPRVGLIVLNQEGDSKHNLLIFHNGMKVTMNQMSFIEAVRPNQLALGAFIVSQKVLQKGFENFIDLEGYSISDTLFMMKLSDQHELRHYMAPELSVFHPYADAIEKINLLKHQMLNTRKSAHKS